MEVELYNWKHSYWVVYDQGRSKGDGYKNQDVFLSSFCFLYDSLREANGIRPRTGVVLRLETKRFEDYQVHLVFNGRFFVNTTSDSMPIGADPELLELFGDYPEELFLSMRHIAG